MHAQRQLAIAAVRAEVKRHEVAKQALSRLRKLADKVGDPELRDSIQASLNSIQGKRRVSSQLGCIRDWQGHRRVCQVIDHFPISHFLVPKMELGLRGRLHLERLEKDIGGIMDSFSQGIKMQVTDELTFLAMQEWVSMGCDRSIIDLDPAWGGWGRKQSGAGGSGIG